MARKSVTISGARLAANILRDTLATSRMSKEKRWRLEIARALLVEKPEAGAENVIVTRDDLARAFSDLAVEEQECFEVLSLDSRHKIIGRHRATKGLVNSAHVHPREAFRHAIADNAVAVAFAHNHPGDSAEPSDQDIRITRRLIEAGELLGIHVLDHLVIHKNGWESCK